MEKTITLTKCPVCLSEDLKVARKVKDFTVSGEEFNVVVCRSCGFHFTNPLPGQEEIGKYYQSEDYVSHTDTKKGLINTLYHIVKRKTIRSKVKMIKKITGKEKGNALDIGCGTGDFLAALAASGWNVTGLEPDEGARQLASSKGIEVFNSDHLFKLQGQFDVITMWHVLEHVHQLDEYIIKIKSLLTEQGKLIIAVPNFDSLDANKYQSYWAAWDVPRHLYHFHPPSMKKLMDRHALKIIQMKRMPFDSFYVSMLSEKYRNGNLISAGVTGLRSYLKALSNRESCSSIIYIISK